MRKTFYLAAFATFLLNSASTAEAENLRLNDQQLDQVTAGSFSGIEDILGSFPGEGVEFPDDVFNVIGGIEFPDDVFEQFPDDVFEDVEFPDDVFSIVNGIFQPPSAE